jgi:hypothetical protein
MTAAIIPVIFLIVLVAYGAIEDLIMAIEDLIMGKN